MNYEPKQNDTLIREGFKPLVITKLTKATAKYTYEGMDLTQPREIFDTMLQKSIEAGAEVTRDGVRIVPSHSEPATIEIKGVQIHPAPEECTPPKQTGIADLISLATEAMKDNTSVLRELLTLKKHGA